MSYNTPNADSPFALQIECSSDLCGDAHTLRMEAAVTAAAGDEAALPVISDPAHTQGALMRLRGAAPTQRPISSRDKRRTTPPK